MNINSIEGFEVIDSRGNQVGVGQEILELLLRKRSNG